MLETEKESSTSSHQTAAPEHDFRPPAEPAQLAEIPVDGHLSHTPPEASSQKPPGNGPLNKLLALALSGWNTLDSVIEKWVDRVATRFKPHGHFLGEFLSPVVSGLVGYGVFTTFHAFGVVSLSREDPAKSLLDEVTSSLASPYFFIAMFLVSMAFVVGSASGESFFSKYIVAPFLDLTEHVMMLAEGVVIGVVVADLIRSFDVAELLTLVWVSSILVGFAYCCVLAKRFCRGGYSEAFTKLHRRVMIRIAGGVAAVLLLHWLVHFAESLPPATESHGHSAGQVPKSETGSTSHDGRGAHAGATRSSGVDAPSPPASFAR